MHIKQIISQNRRDFTAVYECEHCNHSYKGTGYDDSYFHNVVIPNKLCERCNKKASLNNTALSPKYQDGTQV